MNDTAPTTTNRLGWVPMDTGAASHGFGQGGRAWAPEVAALALVISGVLVAFQLLFTWLLVTNYGAYALTQTMAIWSVLLALTVTTRLLYLRFRRRPDPAFKKYVVGELLVVIVAGTATMMDRQPDLGLLMLALVTALVALSAVQTRTQLRNCRFLGRTTD